MSTPAGRRLTRDYKNLQDCPPGGVSAAPSETNLFLWTAIVFGPADTPFEDGTFKLTLEFSEDYPNKPPHVYFTSNIFHPNVYPGGVICVDILQNRWSPTYEVASLLQSIQCLLSNPNPNSPANIDAAKLYKSDRRQYDRKVRKCVEESWMD